MTTTADQLLEPEEQVERQSKRSEKQSTRQVSVERVVEKISVEIPPCVGVDLSTTESRFCMGLNIEDKSQVISIPANVLKEEVSAARGLSLNSGLDFELDEINSEEFSDTVPIQVENHLVFEHGGYAWRVGEAAVARKAPLGIGDSKVDKAVVKLIAGAILLNLQGTMGAGFAIRYKSESDFQAERNRLFEMLAERLIGWSYMGQPGQFTVPAELLFVMPEGYAGWLWCQKQGILFKGRVVVIIDIGHTSTECCLVNGENGNRISLDRTISCSLDLGMHQYAEQVANKLGIPNSESPKLLKAIYEGQETYKYWDGRMMKVVKLREHLPDLRNTFCEYLKAKISEWFPIDGADEIVIFGRGGKYFHAELLKSFESIGGCNLIQPVAWPNALSMHIFTQARAAKLYAAV